MSLTLSGVWPLSLHLDLFNSVERYSLTSRFQKWSTICCTFFQDLKLAGSWLSNFPGGRELNGLLIRKWFGVRGISFSGRSATIVSGLEFNIASVSTKIVLNTSSDNLLEPRMINRVHQLMSCHCHWALLLADICGLQNVDKRLEKCQCWNRDKLLDGHT